MDEESLLFLDGCDAAPLGTAHRCATAPVAVYDYAQLVAVFVGQGMTVEEAEEWIAYNITGAYVGPTTPWVLHRATRTELEASYE